MSAEKTVATTTGHGVEISFAAETNIGLKRKINEDSFLAQLPVFIVADGMGGHSAGDLASAAIVREFSQIIARDDVTLEKISEVISHAQASVVDIAHGTAKGAGSTLSGAVLINSEGTASWVFVNVGDSRVYRLGADGLEQVTKDHSLVQEQIDAGELNPDQAQLHSERNVITRAVGADEWEPDIWMRPVRHGERLLMCTDGLSALVSNGAIENTLMMAGTPENTAHSLIRQALDAGGKDNVSVIVVDVIGGGLPMTSEMGTTEIFPPDLEDTFDVKADLTRNPWAADTVDLPPRIPGNR